MISIKNDNRDIMCKLSNEPDANCNITLDKTSLFEDGGLPTMWTFKNKTYNTATLPCGHTFHPSAISLNFLVNNMRCPVCRQGVEDKMRVTSIPTKIRDEFKDRMGVIVKQEEAETFQDDFNLMLDNMLENVVQAHPNFYKDIWIHVRVKAKDGRESTFYKTPIFRMSLPCINPFQRSFHRALQRVAKLDNLAMKISIFWETAYNIIEIASSGFTDCETFHAHVQNNPLEVVSFSTNQVAVKLENSANLIVSVFPVGIIISVALKIYTMMCEDGNFESDGDASDEGNANDVSGVSSVGNIGNFEQ